MLRNTKIKCLIVDDERKVREYLTDLLQQHFPEVEVLALAEDVDSAAIQLQKIQPNVIFLDVEMGKSTGFDLLASLQKDKEIPLVIFVTGHSSYAIDAIKVAAFDYLLKPLNVKELSLTLERASQKLGELDFHNQLKTLVLQKHLKGLRMDVPVVDGVEFVDLENIILFRALRNYTEIHLKNGEKLLASKTLKFFEQKLPKQYFFRSHRSFLVNIFEIKAYKSSDGGYLVLTNKSKANLTFSRKEQLFDRLAQFSERL